MDTPGQVTPPVVIQRWPRSIGQNFGSDHWRTELGEFSTLARAWAIKGSPREFLDQPTPEQALAHWEPWYRWAPHSHLQPVIKTATNIQQKLHSVLTYFVHPITHAVAEGLNTTIQTAKKAAFTFRGFENFKTAIFFHCGGSQLYRATHAKPR